jgi:lipopolysaccharide/colanic/teichoic acid biosynthesis glycosyltransferase
MSSPRVYSLGYRTTKRVLDILVAALGLVVLSPLLVVAALAVKLDSPGPALFKQARVGKNGRLFEILKLRTMRVSTTGLGVTAAGDTRITKVGRFLRRTKMDELPQLWNVLRGDMSLVGPRPELERYVQRFPDDYARILRVRPGITDFAALEYRDEESVLASALDPEDAYVRTVLPAKIGLYHRYLDEMSLGTDLTLVLRTLAAILR